MKNKRSRSEIRPTKLSNLTPHIYLNENEKKLKELEKIK